MNGSTVVLRDVTVDELPLVAALEGAHGGGFVLSYSLERHRQEFARADVLYKVIDRNGEYAGFVILVLEPDGQSVEFRRIVIADAGKGLGKQVVRLVGDLTRQLGRTRLWLDVFKDNDRARHVYEQCGYTQFDHSIHAGRELLLYERTM